MNNSHKQQRCDSESWQINAVSHNSNIADTSTIQSGNVAKP